MQTGAPNNPVAGFILGCLFMVVGIALTSRCTWLGMTTKSPRV